MNNYKKNILSLMILVILTACASNKASEDLLSKQWNVVATNGEAYTAEFANDTVTFKLGEFLTKGMHYEIKNNEIILKDEDQEEHIFTIEKNENEYTFKAKTDEVREQFGDLTLSPKK